MGVWFRMSCCGLLLATTAIACHTRSRAPAQSPDAPRAGASASDLTADTDAGAAESGGEPDLNSFVAALLTEYTREVHVMCPCRVQESAFTSLDECKRMLGEPVSYIDCATRVLSPADGPELRAWLRCRIEDYQLRSSCLEAHSCDPKETNACYELMKSCPEIDAQVLTPLLYSCAGIFGSRM